MRFSSILFVGLLVLASSAPLAVANEACETDCPPGNSDGPGSSDGAGKGGNASQGNGPEGGPPGQNQSRGNSSQRNASAGNASEAPPAGEDATTRSDKPHEDRRASRQQEVEERRQEARDASREVRRSVEPARDHAALLAELPLELRGRLGQLDPSEGALRGTFVTFQADPGLGLVEEVDADGGPLFDVIYVPISFAETATETLQGKTYRLTGEDWSFRLVDDARVPMRFQTEGEAFLLVLPEGATATPVDNGLQIHYGNGSEMERLARFTGDVAIDPVDPATLVVSGKAMFRVSAERPLLPQVSNQIRDSLETALDQGRLGAETTVIRAEGVSTFVDTVLYEDMQIDFEEIRSSDPVEPRAGYTITVDSESHVGKTIAVTFENGLIDPATLAFRYFNVDADRTVEAPIAQATDLADVLDPLNDGTIAEYWIVQDVDGTQVLLSIPNFSVHQIELMSIIDVVLERPSLLIGTVGAIVLVAVATGGMFRRPEDEA